MIRVRSWVGVYSIRRCGNFLFDKIAHEKPILAGTSAMPIQHINRKGDTYFLHESTTKTGKPKWFFSKKTEGNLAEAIPAGYEIYENHNAQVFLRIIVPTLVTKSEIETVEKGVRKLAKLRYFLVEAKSDSIIVFVANQQARISSKKPWRPDLGSPTVRSWPPPCRAS